MSRVLNDDDFVLLGEVDDLGKEFRRRGFARRGVGIVDYHQLCPLENVRRDNIQIRIEIVLFQQRHIVDFAAAVAGVRSRDRVAGNRHEGNVAGIDKAFRQHRQGGFGAHAVVDLRYGIQLNAEFSFHISSRRLFEFQNAVVGVAAVFDLVDFLRHSFADGDVSHLVVFANAEVEQFAFRMICQRLALGALDLFKFINRRVFAVVGAANSVSK